MENSVPKIMLNYRQYGQTILGRPLKRLLDEAKTDLSMRNTWRMMMAVVAMVMMMIMMMIQVNSLWFLQIGRHSQINDILMENNIHTQFLDVSLFYGSWLWHETSCGGCNIQVDAVSKQMEVLESKKLEDTRVKDQFQCII